MIFGITTVALFIVAIVQLFTDKRITRGYLRKSWISVGLYLAYTIIAIMALNLLMPHAPGPHAVQSLFVAFLGWIGLGILGLIRFAPRLEGQAPPQFLEHVGAIDALFLIVLVAGVGAALGGY